MSDSHPGANVPSRATPSVTPTFAGPVSTRELLARVPLMATGLLSLVAAAWGGLIRLGWNFPTPSASLSGNHGPLMVCGFLGVLICVERAVGIRRSWAWAAPVLAAAAVASLLLPTVLPVPSGPALILAPACFAAAAAVLVGAYVVIWRMQPAVFSVVMGIGAVCWGVGSLLWLAGWPVYRLIPFWEAFLVLTIAGERREMARLQRLSALAQRAFLVAVAGMMAGCLAGLIDAAWGQRLFGISLLGLASWLARWDVARLTIRVPGMSRFVAACLLTGYAWLALGGAIAALRAPLMLAGPIYDAALHAVFLGFVFSMIFGHAPMVVTAVAGIPIAFTRFFYGHVILLQGSLMLRVVGDLGGIEGLRRWGGLVNGVALLVFLGVTAASVLHGKRMARAARSRRDRRRSTNGLPSPTASLAPFSLGG